MVRIAPDDGVVLELAEVTREGHVLGARDILVAEEEHLVREEQGADLEHEAGRARGHADVHVRKLGADGAGQRLDPDGTVRAHEGRRWAQGVHVR